MSRDILLGAVIAAHGLKGEVRVKTFTESPEKIGAYGPLHARGGRVLTAVSARVARPGEAVVRFAGIDDRNAAEALKGTELFVARAALPEPEAEEFYHADLVGLRAEDEEGRVIGTVIAIHNFGAGDVLELERGDGAGTAFLPFTREAVPQIDPENGYIRVAFPERAEAKGNVE